MMDLVVIFLQSNYSASRGLASRVQFKSIFASSKNRNVRLTSVVDSRFELDCYQRGHLIDVYSFNIYSWNSYSKINRIIAKNLE